jgi:hypothetical protein
MSIYTIGTTYTSLYPHTYCIVVTMQHQLISPLDLVLMFFPLALFDEMAQHTNDNITAALSEDKVSKSMKQGTRKWESVVLKDMVQFFGLHVGMTAIKLPNWKSYWSSQVKIGQPQFKRTMSRLRYLLIRGNLAATNR